MSKRIVTKIGDIFCAEIDNEFKRFFQYVAESTDLNSSVLRAFKRHYPMDYIPVMNEIVKDEVEFYAHTVLRARIDYNAWYKVDKSRELGEGYKDVYFRICNDFGKIERSGNWYVWQINKPMVFVGKLPKKYYNLEEGGMMPYLSIIDRLKYGKYMHVSTKF